MSTSVTELTTAASTAAVAAQQTAAEEFLRLILFDKEKKMDSRFFEELEGAEVEISVFNGFPVKCKIIESDGDFLKVEKISRKISRQTMLINKNLITEIEIK